MQQLIRIYLSQKLGISDEEVDGRLLELATLVPDMVRNQHSNSQPANAASPQQSVCPGVSVYTRIHLPHPCWRAARTHLALQRVAALSLQHTTCMPC